MFTIQKLFYFSLTFLAKQVNFKNYGDIHVYLEDINDIVDLKQRRWDRSYEDAIPDKEILNVLKEDGQELKDEFILVLWDVAAEAIGLRSNVTECFHIIDCFMFVLYGHADIHLKLSTPEDLPSILPFTTHEYAIFYKAGEFELSPTYFIDGLSTELWILIWSFFFFFFLGLLISVKIYGKYFSHRRVSVGDVAMYEMNFVANQSHRLSTNKHEKFLSWRIQMICQSVFNIIIACAFSAFILALLSIKTTEKQFNSIEDFAIKRTHVICINPYSAAKQHFLTSNLGTQEIKTEFMDLYNLHICTRVVFERTDRSLCETQKPIALVIETDEFIETPSETCPIVQLKDIFPYYQGTFQIRDDFKYRKALNRIFIQMRSSGIIQRLERKYRKSTFKKDYGTKREYKVHSEGVQFAHVRYIIYGYSCAIILAFIIVIFENIHYYVKNGRATQEVKAVERFSSNLDSNLLGEISGNYRRSD